MAKNDGGPAFPRTENISDEHNGPLCPAQDGMSLRDYFAAAALQGLIQSQTQESCGIATHASYAATYARSAFALADALLAARTGGTDGN